MSAAKVKPGRVRIAGSRFLNQGTAPAGWSAIALVAIGGVLGGGGSSDLPFFDAVCVAAGFVVLAGLVASGGKVRIDRSAWPMVLLACLCFALPMAQLITLPTAVVSGLPGRELADAIRLALGGDAGAPLSLDPDATMISALAIIPGIAMFAGTLRCSAAWRRRILLAWAALAAVATVMGVLQVASGGAVAQMYDTPHHLAATGFFTNRNHNSLFLVLVFVLLACDLFGRKRPLANPLIWLEVIFLLMLVASVVIAKSRAGLMLLMISLPVPYLLSGRRLTRGIPVGWGASAIVSLVAVGTLVAQFNPVARRVLDRFSFGNEGRLDFWPDVLFTAKSFWPVGTGLGTFPHVFATQERLGTINDLYINHAHNDYLELVIECGLGAVVLIVAFAVLFAWRIGAVVRWPAAQRVGGLAAAWGIVLVLLHSLVDYPLRAITLTILFGYLLAMLFPPPSLIDTRETS